MDGQTLDITLDLEGLVIPGVPPSHLAFFRRQGRQATATFRRFLRKAIVVNSCHYDGLIYDAPFSVNQDPQRNTLT